MCLGKVARKAKEFTGYKFMLNNGERSVVGMFRQTFTIYQLGKWAAATPPLDGEDIEIHDHMPGSGDSYAFGFHIFPSIQHAKKYFDEYGKRDDMVLVKVSYRGVLARGIDHTTASVFNKKVVCDVAAQMRVDEIITMNDVEKYIHDLMPKPKRRTITVGEFVDAYNKAADVEDLLHIVNSRLGYDILQQQERLRYKAKLQTRPKAEKSIY